MAEYLRVGREMWHKGPLPPNTWDWGAVVQVGQSEDETGFCFAEFRGNNAAILWPPDMSGKVLNSDQVAMYNNCIKSPPTKRS